LLVVTFFEESLPRHPAAGIFFRAVRMELGLVAALSMWVNTAKRPEKKPIKTNKNKKNNLVQ
jgi:hypothetical protein